MRVSRTRWLGAAALALVVPTGAALVRLLSSVLSPKDLASFHGARLGMSPSDVRARLDIPGSFHPRPSANGMALEFLGADHASVTSCTFEFEEGKLVAMQADLTGADTLADGPALEITDDVVRRRRFVHTRRVLVDVISRTSEGHSALRRQLIHGS
jgi:hypothetical protein